MSDPVVVEHLTAEEHLEKADAAWSAAKKLRGEMDDREVAEGRARGKSSEWYLSREHDFLTLCQIVNLHANLATAKSLVLLKNRSVGIEFVVPPRSPTDRSGSSDIDAINAGLCPLHGTPLNNGRCGIDGGPAHPSRTTESSS